MHETLASNPYQIACLQESKLHSIDSSLAVFIRAYRLDKYAFRPAQGTRVGILLLWNDSAVEISNIRFGHFSITADVIVRQRMTSFTMTMVYGPSRRADKDLFLHHVCSLKPLDGIRWLILGNFNLIYKARDKNNRNLNLTLMGRFRRTLAFCGLKEIALQNRKFTGATRGDNPPWCVYTASTAIKSGTSPLADAPSMPSQPHTRTIAFFCWLIM